MLNMRLTTPSVLIDVSGLTEANYVREDADRVAIGCANTPGGAHALGAPQRSAAALKAGLALGRACANPEAAERCVAHSAHADPSSELPLCLAVLNGEVDHRTRRRQRAPSPGRDFFQGLLQTACGQGELITEVRFPRLPAEARTSFKEMAHSPWRFRHHSGGRRRKAGTDCRSQSAGPLTGPEVRDWPLLQGGDLDDALNELAWSLDCTSDPHAPASYRRYLIRTLGKQAVLEAMS